MAKLSKLFLVLSALSVAVPAFAQGGGSSEVNWVAIAAGFSMAFASGICALAQGKATMPPVDAGDAAGVRKAAEQFVGMFMSQMFTHMFEGVGTNSLFGGGAGEEMFKSVLIDEYGKAAAKQGGLGMTDQIMRALIAQQEKPS